MSKYYIDLTDYQEKLARVPMEFRTFRKAVEIADDMPTVEAIPKDQYVARLQADMVAMLEEFDLELYEKYDDTDLIKVKYIRQAIQQKIDKLKEGSNENNNIYL